MSAAALLKKTDYASIVCTMDIELASVDFLHALNVGNVIMKSCIVTMLIWINLHHKQTRLYVLLKFLLPKATLVLQLQVSKSTNNMIMLATALVCITNINGTPQICRSVIDSVSEISLITTAYAKRLQLRLESSSCAISGIGMTHSNANSINDLGDSRCMAVQRLFNVEKRLAKDPYLDIEYRKFMAEYLTLGHMEVVPANETEIKSYYPHHHAIIKSNSLTTKVRVVFDGSAKSKSGVSLNDILSRRPTTQPELFSILLRFRVNRYVLTGDVE